MTHPDLCTIGYEGAGIEDLLAALRTAGVTLLLDVRAVPNSRKRDFSKAKLAAHLDRASIAYRHLRGLGTPKTGREAAARGDRAGFERIFAEQLVSEEGRHELALATELACSEPACLLCLERDVQCCHRLIVAERIAAATGQRIRHLEVG